MIDTSKLAFPKPNHLPGEVRLSAKELKKERKRRWEQGDRICHICTRPILDFADYVLDHEKPGKMGGCRNSHGSNLKPAHFVCNSKKGSRRDYGSNAGSTK